MVEFSEILDKDIIIFAHRCPRGVERLFNISSLLADPRVKKHMLRKIQIDPSFALNCLQAAGIEAGRLCELIFEEDSNEPVIYAQVDDEILLVDGNHRYVARTVKGYEWIYGKVLIPKIWKDHLITGFTSEQLDILIHGKNTSFSSLREEMETHGGIEPRTVHPPLRTDLEDQWRGMGLTGLLYR